MKMIKSCLCLALCLFMVLSLAGCMNRDNITPDDIAIVIEKMKERYEHRNDYHIVLLSAGDAVADINATAPDLSAGYTPANGNVFKQ